ncbi:MAG: metallophosphoesterase [Caldilineaceae bacterium]|nr:metallophosphoesterase [Caldilineaceae bacterium]
MNTDLSRPNAHHQPVEPLRRMRDKISIVQPCEEKPTAQSPAVSRRAGSFWVRFLWLLAPMLIIDGSTTWSLAASGDAVQGAVTEVRSLYPSEWGMPYPVGLAYVPDRDFLVLFADVNISSPISDSASVVTITPYEDFVGAAILPIAGDNAINLAYAAAADRLLFLDQAASEIVQAPMGSDGIPDAGGLARFDSSELGLGQPQGMVVDAVSRRLFILDNNPAAIVVADLDSGFAFVSEFDLTALPATDLRGLALHPDARTLFVTSPSQGLLFELTVSGSLLNTYNLASLALQDVRGLAFGPSADLTDAPDTIHLFLADNGAFDAVSPLGRIVEAALPPQDSSGVVTLRFAVIGDYGKDNEAEARVAALIQGWNPDFIVTTGDNNYPDGAASTIDDNIGKYFGRFIGNYQGAYGPGSAVNRFWPSLGNHDWRSMTCVVDSCSSAYLDYFTLPNNERYYAADYGLVRLFAVDSESGEPDGRSQDSAQAAWLSSQLAASTACYNVVFFHRAPYGSGRHGSSSTMQWPFAAWGAQAVLSGHDHLYERLEVGGIPYIVNGAGGATLYNFENIGNLPAEAISIVRYNQDYGAMLVTATTTGITYQFYTAGGILIDSYTVAKECESAPPTFTPTMTPTATPTVTPTVTTVPDATETPTVTATVNNSSNGPDYLHLPIMVK